MDFLSEVKTYNCDLELFKELGLKPFCFDMNKVKNRTKYVGKVKASKGKVKIWMQGHPAQFWQFEVEDTEGGNKYFISTGSGALTDFWPTIKKMARNMFVVNKIEKL